MPKFAEVKKEYTSSAGTDIFIGNDWKNAANYGKSIYGRVVNLESKEFSDKGKDGKEVKHVRPCWTIQLWDITTEKPLSPEKFVKTPAHSDFVAGMAEIEITDVIQATYIGPGTIETSDGMWPTYKILKDTANSPVHKQP
jgi:hypothetical protein